MHGSLPLSAAQWSGVQPHCGGAGAAEARGEGGRRLPLFFLGTSDEYLFFQRGGGFARAMFLTLAAAPASVSARTHSTWPPREARWIGYSPSCMGRVGA